MPWARRMKKIEKTAQKKDNKQKRYEPPTNRRNKKLKITS